MSIVYQPEREHVCRPGWRWKTATEDGMLLKKGMRYGIPPTLYEFPPGTVWRCDCGRTWVSRASRADNAPGLCLWRRESWWARRRRIKRESARQRGTP